MQYQQYITESNSKSVELYIKVVSRLIDLYGVQL